MLDEWPPDSLKSSFGHRLEVLYSNCVASVEVVDQVGHTVYDVGRYDGLVVLLSRFGIFFWIAQSGWGRIDDRYMDATFFEVGG
jgi:hypothetical protein